MEAEGERFRRLGSIETRCAVRVLPDDGGAAAGRCTGLVFDGYRLSRAEALPDPWPFDPDFVVSGREAVWRRMLEETARRGRPELRHTLNSLVLIGDELWLESRDQLREDRFYRFNQSLQEFFDLASRLDAARP
jgi:hypothetical protein